MDKYTYNMRKGERLSSISQQTVYIGTHIHCRVKDIYKPKDPKESQFDIQGDIISPLFDQEFLRVTFHQKPYDKGDDRT